MRITKETAYIMENEDGERALAPTPGEWIEVELRDGTYRTGRVSEVSEHGIILSKGGDHLIGVCDIVDYKRCEALQKHMDSSPISEDFGGMKLQ